MTISERGATPQAVSRRDHFAAAAMQALIASREALEHHQYAEYGPPRLVDDPHALAARAFEIADAMVEGGAV